jgi:hypothetical protein
MTEWTLSTLHRKAYGHNIKHPPVADRCCEDVTTYHGRWPHHKQCSRPRGYGPEKAYCKQHDPDVVAARQKAVDERQEVEWQKKRIEWAGPRLFAALCKITDGDNDPRTTALAAIKGLKRPETPHP